MGPNEKATRDAVDALKKRRIGAVNGFMVESHMLTTEGGASVPGTPVDTGEARSGGRVSFGTPSDFVPPKGLSFNAIWGRDEAEAALSEAKEGDPRFWANNVGHANILEGGRRFSENAGRMIGSEQAEDGFFSQAIDEAADRFNRGEIQ